MAKKDFMWDVKATWEVNIAAAIAAQNARKPWSAARRRKQSRALKAAHKRKRAAKKKLQKAATDRYFAAKKVSRPKPLPGFRGYDFVLRAMVPGEWYAVTDLAGMPGCERAKFILRQDMARPPRLWVEMAANEDFEKRDMDHVPQFLWRLTPAGEAARELSLMLA